MAVDTLPIFYFSRTQKSPIYTIGLLNKMTKRAKILRLNQVLPYDLVQAWKILSSGQDNNDLLS